MRPAEQEQETAKDMIALNYMLCSNNLLIQAYWKVLLILLQDILKYLMAKAGLIYTIWCNWM